MVCACFLVLLVVADVEGVLDDAADDLRREEVDEFRGERFGEGIEVVAMVAAETARHHHFLDVRVVRFCGERGAVGETPFASSRRNASTSPL